MANLTQKFQVSTSGLGTFPLTGYALATGNTSITTDLNFAAAAVNSAITLAFTLAGLQSIFLTSDKGCTIKTNGTGTADVQTLAISGTPTGGSVALDFAGQSTIIAYNATAAAVQTALQALSTIGTGNVTCTGGPLPGTAVVCTFAGTKATGKQPLMTAFSGALTGGTTPAATVTHTTLGLPSDTITLLAGIPLTWVAGTGTPCPFTSDVTAAYVSNTPAQRLQISGLTT